MNPQRKEGYAGPKKKSRKKYYSRSSTYRVTRARLAWFSLNPAKLAKMGVGRMILHNTVGLVLRRFGCIVLYYIRKNENIHFSCEIDQKRFSI